MSASYYCSTYIVEPSSLPEVFTSIESLRDYKRPLRKALSGSTRSGWMHFTLDEVASAYAVKSLSFLGLDRGDIRLEEFDSECPDGPIGYYFVSTLCGARLSDALLGTKSLIASIIRSPSKIGKILEDYNDIHDIIEAAHDTGISEAPAFEYGDEGQGAHYFFAFLRAFASVCEKALSEGKTVLYVLESPA